MQDTSSAFYKKRKIPIYGQEVYLDVGRAFCISILDLYCLNPLSRLLKKKGDTLQDALTKIKNDIKRDLSKPSIKSMKKKSKFGAKAQSQGPTFELVMAEKPLAIAVTEAITSKITETTEKTAETKAVTDEKGVQGVAASGHIEGSQATNGK